MAVSSRGGAATAAARLFPWLLGLLLAAVFVGQVRSRPVIRGDGRPLAAASLPPTYTTPRVIHDDAEETTGWWGSVRRVAGRVPYGLTLLDAAAQWVDHNDARLGAALAYYSIFSIGPLIVIAIAIAGLFFGGETARGEVTSALKGLLGEQGAGAIDMMLLSANQPREGTIAIIIGLGTLVLAGIGVVTQLKAAMNIVWQTPPSASQGIWSFLRTYILSLAGLATVGFLLLVSMLMTAGLAAVGRVMPSFLPEPVLQFVGAGTSLAVMAVMFALMFKWLPDAQVAWRDVVAGAILTALLFEAGKFVIAFYIGKQGLESTYGAAASIVVVLVWVYYSAQIVLYGAEFTSARAKQRKAGEARLVQRAIAPAQ